MKQVLATSKIRLLGALLFMAVALHAGQHGATTKAPVAVKEKKANSKVPADMNLLLPGILL